MKLTYPGITVAAVELLIVWLAVCPAETLGAAAKTAGHYLGPSALVASPDGKTLYVACADARQIAWVGLPKGDVIRRVDLPAEPTGLALSADGSKLIVTCAAPKSTVAVLDTASGELIQEIPAGHTAVSPAIGPDGRRVYVCNRFDNDVSVIDLVAGRQIARVPAVREPIAAALTPDGQTLLVANHLPDARTDSPFDIDVAPTITVVDCRTFETSQIELFGGSHSLREISILPDGSHAVATHLMANFLETPFRVDMGWVNTNVVSIIDVPGRRLAGTIGLDDLEVGAANPWGVVAAAGGSSVCVSLAGTQQLSFIDTSLLLSDKARRTMSPLMGAWPIYTGLGASYWQRVNLPGIGPRGLAAVESKVYVAEYFSDTIAVVDLESPGDGPIRSIALGPPPKLDLERRGEMLFNDGRLCYLHWVSCASCHPDGRTDALNWDLMNDGQGNSKNTKSMLLAHRTPPSMAEGVRDSAETAVRSGITHILFTDRPEEDAAAIDAYLKSLRAVPSPRLVDGRLNPAAARGRKLFTSDRVGCRRCHPGPLYTDLAMHDVGTRNPREYSDRFDTPSLVEVWRTAPYLHDGRYTTIEELLVEGRHGLSRSQDLTEREIHDLVEFVLSL